MMSISDNWINDLDKPEESDTRPFPIQQEGRFPSGTIPWWLAKEVYKTYGRAFGHDQSLERLAERGGFGRSEVVNLLANRRIK